MENIVSSEEFTKILFACRIDREDYWMFWSHFPKCSFFLHYFVDESLSVSTRYFSFAFISVYDSLTLADRIIRETFTYKYIDIDNHNECLHRAIFCIDFWSLRRVRGSSVEQFLWCEQGELDACLDCKMFNFLTLPQSGSQVAGSKNAENIAIL